jgi:hypothetical protein
LKSFTRKTILLRENGFSCKKNDSSRGKIDLSLMRSRATAGFLVSAGWGFYFATANKETPIGVIVDVLVRLTQPAAAAIAYLNPDYFLGLRAVAIANAVTYAFLGLIAGTIRRHFQTLHISNRDRGEYAYARLAGNDPHRLRGASDLGPEALTAVFLAVARNHWVQSKPLMPRSFSLARTRSIEVEVLHNHSTVTQSSQSLKCSQYGLVRRSPGGFREYSHRIESGICHSVIALTSLKCSPVPAKIHFRRQFRQKLICEITLRGIASLRVDEMEDHEVNFQFVTTKWKLTVRMVTCLEEDKQRAYTIDR